MMHDKHLPKMPHVIKRDASSLRKLMKYVSSHMNALQALSLNVYVQDLILNNLMPATIDPESQREWEFFTATRTFTSTTEVIVTFLESRYRTLQRIHITQAQKMAPVTSRSSHPTGSKVSKPSYSNVATQLRCTLWKESNRLFRCDKFLDMQFQQRLNHVKRSRLCYNCLQPFTRNDTCSTEVCRRCHKRHHTLLHINV